MENITDRFNEWLTNVKAYRPETIKQYINYYKKFFAQYEVFNRDNVWRFVTKRYHNYASRGFVKCFIKFMEDYEDEFDPDILKALSKLKLPKPKRQQKLPLYYLSDEIQAIIQYIYRHNTFKERDTLMVKLSFGCGLRASELLGLEVRDLNWREWLGERHKLGKLKLRSDIAKRGKERFVFVPPELMFEVEKFILHQQAHGKISKDKDRLFDIKIRRWQKILEVASVKAIGVNKSPHKLRHGYATFLINDNDIPITSVQKLLGHANLSTTQIYTHITDKKVEEDLNEVFGVTISE